MTQNRAASYQDADLVLRFYEMRREDVMRRSRDAISFGFWPKDLKKLMAIFEFDHPENAAWRQVCSYWEMVFGFGKRGIVEPEFLVENSGEGILLYMKVQPFLANLRADAPLAFLNTEWAATQTEAGRQRVAFFEKRFADKLTAAPAQG